jgi:hypothetical protein
MTAREGVMACEALGLDKQEMEKVKACYVTRYFCASSVTTSICVLDVCIAICSPRE